MRILLSLDLSTTCTGWAKFNLDTMELIAYGFIKPDFKNPKKKGIPLYTYPRAQVLKLRKLSKQVLELINHEVELIVVEEINRGKNRLGQKVLDGFHFMLLDRIFVDALPRVLYFDSDGSDGWRSKAGLKLQLSDMDKIQNKERKKLNKKIAKGQKKLDIITQKTLACRYVNKTYGLKLNDDLNESDGDIADAIGLGHFFLTKVKQ